MGAALPPSSLNFETVCGHDERRAFAPWALDEMSNTTIERMETSVSVRDSEPVLSRPARMRLPWPLKTLLPVAAALLNGLLLFVLLTVSLDSGPRRTVLAIAAGGAFIVVAGGYRGVDVWVWDWADVTFAPRYRTRWWSPWKSLERMRLQFGFMGVVLVTLGLVIVTR